MPNTKIATCCYWGTRAALVLNGSQTHELACSSCGAPLHDLKKLRADAVRPEAHRMPQKGRKGKRRAVHSPFDLVETALRQSSKKRKRKKGLLHEAFDLLDDIFD